MEHIKEPGRSPAERIVAALNDDCTYHMHTLSGHNPAAGRLVFQPLIRYADERSTVGYNETPLSHDAMTAYVELLERDLTNAGIDAIVRFETTPAPHIVVDMAE